MPRIYKPRPKPYTEADIAVAIEEVENGTSVRSTAKKYCLSTSMLRKRVQANRGLVTLKKQGCKLRLPIETEEEFAAGVRQMAEWGFRPNLKEFMERAYKYFCEKGLTHLFNGKQPGYCWAKSFLERHNLGGLIQLGRKSPPSSHTPPDATSTLALYEQLQRLAPPGMKYVIYLVPEDEDEADIKM